MQMTIDVPEEILIQFGKESIEKEIARTLKWMEMRPLLEKISAELQTTFEPEEYQRQLEMIRQSAWDEYKIGLVT